MLDIIIIGTGEFAYEHARTINQIDNVNLIGFVGSNKKIGEDFSLPVYESIEDAVKKVGFDKAVIVNRNDKHFESLIKLIKLNKDILCEKPAVISSQQLDMLDRELKNYKGRFHVVGQRKYDELITYIKSEEIRKIFGELINVHLLCSFKKNEEYYDSWRGDTKKAGGGVLIHNAIHYIGLLNYLLGRPIKVKGSLIYHNKIKDYEVGANANIEYENNKKAVIKINPEFNTKFEMHLDFENGKMIVNDNRITDIFVKDNKFRNLRMKFLLLRKFKRGTLIDQYKDFLSNNNSVNTYEKSKDDLKIIFELYKKISKTI